MTIPQWSEFYFPEHDEPESCEIGPAGHEWQLTIEEGSMALTSGCQHCDDAILGPVGGQDVYMSSKVVGRLVFEPEHPRLGGWHGFDRCDCGWQWRFVPQGVRPERLEDR